MATWHSAATILDFWRLFNGEKIQVKLLSKQTFRKKRHTIKIGENKLVIKAKPMSPFQVISCPFLMIVMDAQIRFQTTTLYI